MLRRTILKKIDKLKEGSPLLQITNGNLMRREHIYAKRERYIYIKIYIYDLGKMKGRGKRTSVPIR